MMMMAPSRSNNACLILLLLLALWSETGRTEGSTEHCDNNDPDFVWDSKLKECLEVGNNTLLSKCKSDLQCLKSSLGSLSRCSPETGLCECYDWEQDGRSATICFNGKCYRKKHLQDFCTDTEECQAGVHVDAVCVKHPDFLPHETICVCPKGRSCKNLGDVCESDRECRDGVSDNAVCQPHIGELVCTCPQGAVCTKELRDATNKRNNTFKILSIVGGVLGGVLVVVVVVVVVLRCRKKSYFV